MSNKPRIVIVEDQGIRETFEYKEDELLSWGMTFKLRVFRLLHLFGVHYLVRTYVYDAGSDRPISVGSSCWFCDGV